MSVCGSFLAKLKFDVLVSLTSYGLGGQVGRWKSSNICKGSVNVVQIKQI